MCCYAVWHITTQSGSVTLKWQRRPVYTTRHAYPHTYALNYLCMVSVFESACTLCKWFVCVCVRVCVAAGTWLSILSSCSVLLFCRDSMRDRIPVPVMKLDSTFRLFSVVFTFNISASAWGSTQHTHCIFIHSLLCSYLIFGLDKMRYASKINSIV